MNHREKNEALNKALVRLGRAPIEDMEAARQRVRQSLRSKAAVVQPETDESSLDARTSLWNLRRPYFLAAAAGVVVVVLSVTGLRSTANSARAVVESADGSLYRISGGSSHDAFAGDRIESGEAVRSQAAAVLALADGSHVEMRVDSELALERADDGVRIRLTQGSIIVTAAKQRKGHLYVQTKDMTASVVGTVFLVNAEEQGSRVVVIQGEVQVQQGVSEKKLRPGEQVATNPNMLPAPVIEEIAWSRNAAAHFALLQQSVALLEQPSIVAPPPPPQTPSEPREVFEVISIRPSSGPVGGGLRGGPGGGRGGGPGIVSPCGGMLQVDPGRFTATITAYRLITLAYGRNCPTFSSTEPDLISAGPGWIKSEAFDIQTVTPTGSPTYTRSQLLDGNAPKLQMMIQSMLADRFKLAIRREMKEMPVYNLVVVGKGKLSESQISDVSAPAGMPARGPGAPSFLIDPPNGVVRLLGNGVPISGILNLFQGQLGRPIIDKTDLKGKLYDIPEITGNVGAFELGGPSVWPLIAPALLPQLGLKLEPATGPVEILVIDRIEKPSEN